MKSKILALSILFLSAFIFSACTLNPQTNQNFQITPTPINTETGNETENELQQQINTDSDDSFDADFDQMETELGK